MQIKGIRGGDDKGT